MPATGGSLFLLHFRKRVPLDVTFKFETVSRGEKRNLFLFPLLHSFLFPDICLHPGFPPILGLSVPAVLLFFCFLLFHLEIFFLKHFLPST